MRFRLYVLIGLTVAGVLGASSARAQLEFVEQAGSVDALHVPLGEVEDFRLINQKGQPVTRDDLKGQVWVASFFYATCPECNQKHIPNLQKLYRELSAFPNVKLVSFSVNPLEDDPKRLARFAEGHGAEGDRWYFLTVPPEAKSTDAIYDLAEKGFKVARPVEKESKSESGKDIIHSFRLIVVDEKGRIQGSANNLDESQLPRVRDRVKRLVQSQRLSEGYYFPTLNAGLNALSGVLLVLGYMLVRARRLVAHKWVMLGALLVSAVFLGCYLYYHIVIRGGEPTRFLDQGWVRTAYFAVLLSHTVLAAAVAPLALTVTYLGLRDKLRTHVRLARWTLPLWLYVSVTGVVVYWMLYHL